MNSQQTATKTDTSRSGFRQTIFAFNFLRLFFAWGMVMLAAASARAQGLEGPPPPDLPSAETASPLPTVQDPASTVVARVNGAPIFQSEVEHGVAEISHNQKLEANSLALAQAAVLQQIIDRDLIHNYLNSQKLTANEADVNAAIDRLRATLQKQNTNIDDFLARTHQTEASLRSTFAYELGWDKFVAHSTNDESLQALFKTLHEQLDGTQRRVSHILLRPDGAIDQAKLKALIDKAKTLRDQINSGSLTFEAGAEKYSAGPSHSHGGDLGFIPLNGMMAESFSKAAFALKPGEISEPVATPFGVHLIKVTDVKPGNKTWQDARDGLQKALSNYLFKQLVKNQLDKTTVEFAAGVPHFKKGTMELETNENAANLQ